MSDKHLFVTSLCAGGMAGFVVDIVLFPLDTIKTRLQAKPGFKKSGGFRGVYKGIGPQAIGSAPQAALFFCTYEAFKASVTPLVPSYCEPFVHMAGASIGEVVSCSVRVPVEVIKQRRQTWSYIQKKNVRMSSLKIAMSAYKEEGIQGFYRGFGSTIIREVPFSFIQFPILEQLKYLYSTRWKNNKELEPYEVAMCGSIAGGTSAAITTPLDVIKTRIMLADSSLVKKEGALSMSGMMRTVYKESGIRGFFAGFIPRVVWITLGGYIFFGMYDLSKHMLNNYFNKTDGDSKEL